ncbi:MAG: AMP-binding protein [Proteobacteria bacterium]|nr:AMP-binding protein [Pseudomonadota bacterium]
MHPSGHVDSFARDRLPPAEAWPKLLLDHPAYRCPDRLNIAEWLLDRWIAAGHGDAPCLISARESLTYGELHARVNRIANLLVGQLGLVPGGRVLLCAANSPMLVAAYLAVIKAGGIAVATMPLLQAGELAKPVARAEIRLALCDAARHETVCSVPGLERVIAWHSPGADGLEALIAQQSDQFTAADTASDDVCLLGMTSGTTGGPKLTMHFHRDVLAIQQGFGAQVLRPTAADRFIGSPPLAFTFGLGGLVVFPLAVGASVVLNEGYQPDELLVAIATHGATMLFTAPTAYKALLPRLAGHDISTLRACVSAGEALPAPVFAAWHAATGIELIDGMGSTEMLHVFICSGPGRTRAGTLGLPLDGYRARIVDDAGRELGAEQEGLLEVQGPVGCRYLDDPRQALYVRHGWNRTGDVAVRDADGYYRYVARADDMIVSAGYNISGPEVEAALLAHPAVAECAVIGAPDAARGMVVKAFVVPAPGVVGDAALVRALQDHAKAVIAPYKYPRAIAFRDSLPKTATGKLRRSALRDDQGA